jgi:predicted dinucleotide-binding enzyme
MKVAVLGTGNVGQTIANKLLTLGHEVALGRVQQTIQKQ